jgi:hypothetical protein
MGAAFTAITNYGMPCRPDSLEDEFSQLVE